MANVAVIAKYVCRDDDDFSYYVELPDGYRLIYEDGKYVGRYNPNLEQVI